MGETVLDVAATAGSPDWWMLRLGHRLQADRPRLQMLHDYWSGSHPLPFGNQRMRSTYRRFQKMSRTNFMALVAESLLERLKVVGFRAGGKATEQTDRTAWKWWQANDMDSASGLVHRAAVVMSRAYVIVGRQPDEPSQPLITGEDPRQVTHEEDPSNRRNLLAAMKTWWDDVERRHRAVLYLPDEVHYYQTPPTKESTSDDTLWQPQRWDVESEPVGNSSGVVPVVPFRNRPDLCGECLGEFEDIVDIQDRINMQILDRMVISTTQAYRQRFATGVEVTDEDGRAQAPFDPGADLLWVVPDDKAKFGDFTAADLSGVINAVEADVQHLAGISRTPPHYLLGTIINAAGSALAAAETGLWSKATERLTEFSASWEEVYRQAGVIIGEDIPDDAEVLWADPQFRSMAEKAAASVQLVAAGVPWRTRMTMLDFTPQEIDRMTAERVSDAMLSMSLAPQQPGAAEGRPPGTEPPGGRTPPQPNGAGGNFSMRNGPASAQGRQAETRAATVRTTSGR